MWRQRNGILWQIFQSRIESYVWKLLTPCRDITKILTSILFILRQHSMNCKYWDNGNCNAMLNIYNHECLYNNLTCEMSHIYIIYCIQHTKNSSQLFGLRSFHAAFVVIWKTVRLAKCWDFDIMKFVTQNHNPTFVSAAFNYLCMLLDVFINFNIHSYMSYAVVP